MSDITYDDFERMEKSIVSRGSVKPRWTAKDFVKFLLEERPHTLSELEVSVKDTQLRFNSRSPVEHDVYHSLNDLVEEDVVEARYGIKGKVYYGLKKRRK